MWGSASARLQGMSEARSLPAGVRDTLRFGVFAVDRKTGELRRNGVKVRLQDQPLQILLTLLERPGEVVTREELRGRLWPDDTFVDFEHSINTAVRRLRDALGDSAENPRFVETVARKGYRFLAPVSGAADESTSPEAVGAHPHPARLWWILGVVVLALVVGIIVGFHAGSSTTPEANIAERRLTANAPELPVLDGVISPEGKYLAFTDPSGFYPGRSIQERHTRSSCRSGSTLGRGAGSRMEAICWRHGLPSRGSRTVSGRFRSWGEHHEN